MQYPVTQAIIANIVDDHAKSIKNILPYSILYKLL